MLTAFLLVPAFLQAQVMVVRVDGNKVYLDTSVLNRNVQKGDLFKVILSAEKLTNPKTGKDLGLVYNYSQEGKIVEVQPLYAIGEVAADKRISVGQEVVLTATAPRTASPCRYRARSRQNLHAPQNRLWTRGAGNYRRNRSQYNRSG